MFPRILQKALSSSTEAADEHRYSRRDPSVHAADRAEIKQELALALFQREKLTLGQASQLAGMNQWQFQQLLGSRNIPIHYGVADFEADLRTLDDLRRS